MFGQIVSDLLTAISATAKLNSHVTQSPRFISLQKLHFKISVDQSVDKKENVHKRLPLSDIKG